MSFFDTEAWRERMDERWFDTGVAMAEAGAVDLVALEDDKVTAHVTGSVGDLYVVQLWAPAGEGTCTCPGFEKFGACKHQAAVVSAANAADLGKVKDRMARLRDGLALDSREALIERLGAERAILYREEDFQPIVRDLTGGEGVHVVYDSVGKDTIHRSMASLRRRGTCVLFGASSGPVPSIEPIELAEAGSIFFTRPHLADYIATADERRGRASDLFAAYRTGNLHVAIDRELPLDAAVEAHGIMEGRATRGKVVLRIASDDSVQ